MASKESDLSSVKGTGSGFTEAPEAPEESHSSVDEETKEEVEDPTALSYEGDDISPSEIAAVESSPTEVEEIVESKEGTVEPKEPKDGASEEETENDELTRKAEVQPRDPENTEAATPASPKVEEKTKAPAKSRKMVLLIVAVFVVVIILLGVIVGLLVRDDDVNRGVANQDSPTGAPAVSVFSLLSTTPGANELSTVSTCDDCQEIVQLSVETAFDVTIRSATVSSNGFVDLHCDEQGLRCLTIDVFAADLSPNDQGEVFVSLPANDTIVVSWENVTVRDTQSEGIVNVQVVIHLDSGDVVICFGDGDTKRVRFRTGVWNAVSETYIPAVGEAFDDDGYSSKFPENTCQRLNGEGTAILQMLTEETTTQPGQRFIPLSSEDDAEYMDAVSACEDCRTVIELPFSYTYTSPVTGEVLEVPEIEVSSNGRIYMRNCGLGSTVCAVLAVVSADLNPLESNGGGIYVLDATQGIDNPAVPQGAFIVSWEQIPFCCGQPTGESESLSVVSGQVHIYPEQRIDLCWGEGWLSGGDSFTAGYLDLVNGNLFPPVGSSFQSGGQTFPGQFPTLTCETILGTATQPDIPSPPGDLYPRPFPHLSGTAGAYTLPLVSNGDDEEYELKLQIPIKWFGDTYVQSLLVSSNGQIRTGDCSDGWGHGCGVIDVAFADLDPSMGGNVFLLNVTRLFLNQSDPTRAASIRNQGRRLHDMGHVRMQRHAERPGVKRLLRDWPIFDLMYVVSWESVPFHNDTASFIHAQARFFHNGTIELCWGEARTGGNSIAAGLADPRYSESIPASGGPFGTNGVTVHGTWPDDHCQMFPVAGDGLGECADAEPSRECLLAMTLSDLNRDSRLNQPEFVRFVNRLSDNSHNSFYSLPGVMIGLYYKYAIAYGQIDITGSLPGQNLTSEESKFLGQFCCETDSLLDYEQPTRPPHPQPSSFPSPSDAPAHQPTRAPAPFPRPTAAPHGPHQPTRSPAPFPLPTAAPNGQQPLECQPTRGVCASSFDELNALSSRLRWGETLGICGSFQVQSSIEISQENVTVCCTGASRCRLSGGGDRIMAVTAPNVTVRGLSFVGGRKDDADGGNLLIESPGYFEVSQCSFSNGTTITSGGNLMARNAHSITISNCLFENGHAINAGAVGVENTKSVVIESSYFRHNTASRVGGGLLVSSGQHAESEISIKASHFEGNMAVIGGGFASFWVARSVTVKVQDSYFHNNHADEGGGAGAVLQRGELRAIFSGNRGIHNTAEEICHDLYFYPDPVEGQGTLCLDVSEYFVLGFEFPSASPYPIPTSPPHASHPSHSFHPTTAHQHTPQPTNTYAPTTAPQHTTQPTNAYHPTTAPQYIPTCEPTHGGCAASFAELMRYNSILRPGDTLAICGSIFMEAPLVIQQARITFCCYGLSRCTLENDGDQILIISAAHVAIRGLTFFGGSAEGGNGGNVAIDSHGSFEISACHFMAGFADYGGNLYVRNADSVAIRSCIFEGGLANVGGAGVAISGTPDVTIDSSYFEGHLSVGEGGGILVTGSSELLNYNVVLTSNYFSGNLAEYGGGFAVSNLETNLALTVENSFFHENEATSHGGAGSVSHRGPLYAIFSGNLGQSNGSPDSCPDFYFDPDPTDFDGTMCWEIAEDLSLGTSFPSVAPYPQPSRAPWHTFAPSPPFHHVPTSAPHQTSDCQPTTGICASTFEELLGSNNLLRRGGTLAVCGNIVMADPLVVSESQVTMCCSASARCRLLSDGRQALIVSGTDVTIRGIKFEGGANDSDNGGNVAIDSQGSIELSACHFLNGSAVLGGNLFVQNAGSLNISSCIFEAGTAKREGGGVAILGTPDVSISASYFQRNTCGRTGGGFVMMGGADGNVYHASLHDNYFEGNIAEYGGGFALIEMGDQLSLEIGDSYFGDNVARGEGGAGAVIHRGEITALVNGNRGGGNLAVSGGCEHFYFYPDPQQIGDSLCADVGEHLSIDSGFPSAVPHPSLPPYPQPTRAPSYNIFPTHSPLPVPVPTSSPQANQECRPTSGFCVSSYEALVSMSSRLQRGETLAVCGTIDMVEPVAIGQPNVVICCADGSRCSLQSNGGQNLVINAGNVTLKGLTMHGGSNLLGDGGNVMVDSSGSLHISACRFRHGNARSGGNLFVRNADNVTISNSIFELGFANSGGSIGFENVSYVTIEDSFFEGNSAGEIGGGILYNSTSPSIVSYITLRATRFESNRAVDGGGFATTSIGGSLALKVVDSYFIRNGAAHSGGAGAIFQSPNLVANFVGNLGDENHAGEECDGFFLFPVPSSSSSFLCISASDDYALGVATPSPHPLTQSPSQSPLQAPSSGCEPTLGGCIRDYSTLASLTSNAALGADNTASLCAGTIVAEEAIVIAAEAFTLCCAEPGTCYIESGGFDRNVVVTGRDSRLQGIIFSNGIGSDDGGNVAILAPGHHVVSNCSFFFGTSDFYGGNLFVRAAESLQVDGSVFSNGLAGAGGGGIALWNTPSLSVRNSHFESNHGGSNGGGIFLTSNLPDLPQTTVINNSTFIFNAAEYGGGFLETSIGSMPRLTVTNSFFLGNEGFVEGGAGMVFNHRGDLDLRLMRNNGSRNLGSECDGFSFVISDSHLPECFEVTANFAPPETPPP